MEIQLSSPAFSAGMTIPRKYTCDGENVSPPLEWSGVPDGAQALGLIASDPDAPSGTWVHWVLYNLPGSLTNLQEGARGQGSEGVNDFHKTGYGGPCPPRGSQHRYIFTLYALDSDLQLKPGLKKSDLEKAMQGHILAQGQFMGKYSRA